MEIFKLPLLCLLPFLLLANVDNVAGDELRTFIVHVQPHEEVTKELGLFFHPLVYAGASGKPSSQFCVPGSLDVFDVTGKIVVCEFGGGIPRVVKGAVVQKAGASNSTQRPVAVSVVRTVKNVGEVPSSYYAAVDMANSTVRVIVHPDRLDFTEANQERSFRVVMIPHQSGPGVVQGALRWVSDSHTVRSPISVTLA
ncbi:hypothetical protein EJB05_38420, partial [Eragrostis curvula]